MESLHLLSEAIIETLKAFSSTSSPLSADSLRAALSDRKDIRALLKEVPEIAESDQALAPSGGAGCVSLKTSERVRQPDLSRTVQQVVATFNMILATLERIAREDTLPRSSELRQRLDACQTVESLVLESGEVLNMVDTVVNGAAGQIDSANDFLTDLSDNLLAMEKDLFSFQSHNRKTFMLHDQFCDNLLSQTREIDKVVVVSKAIEDARNIISSRLSVIGRAIESKRRENEIRLAEADSTIAELQMSVRNYSEEINKVTQRARELEKEVLLDSLLNINNRRAYDLQIVESIRSFRRNGQSFSVIMIDVDHFKDINDQFGHRAGDKCLQELAKLVEGCVRKTDFLARYGGEELVIIVPGSNKEQTRRLAEKIRDRINRTRFLYQNQAITLTISLGVTEVRPSDTDHDNLFVRVDRAMYDAKEEGRNRVLVA